MTAALEVLRPAVDTEKRARLAGKLAGVAKDLARGNIASEPYAYVLVFLGRDGPEVSWQGLRTWDECRDAATAITDMIWLKQHGTDLREMRQKNVALERDRQRRWQIEHPFHCPYKHCYRDRFKSHRGLQQHLALRGASWWGHRDGELRPWRLADRPTLGVVQ